MHKGISKYVKECPESQRYMPSNLKPADLLQIPALKQKFEVLAIDPLGPLSVQQMGSGGY